MDASAIDRHLPLHPEAFRTLLGLRGREMHGYALVKELEIGGPVFATKDAREGPRAFAEKRKPEWKGR